MIQRKTKQRQAILQVVEAARRPLSPVEILQQAQHLLPALGIATVYRALGTMLQEGLLVPVDIPGQSPRYERAGLTHHHHCACTGCGQVFELEGCCYTGESAGIPAGFKVEAHDVILYGHCRSCQRR